MQETVMVVDDEAAVLSALCRLFRSAGYRILTARSAEEGLKASEIRRKNTELRQLCAQLKGSFLGAMEAMATMAEVRDPYTAGHQRRVSRLASFIAEVMGLATGDPHG